MKQTQYNDAAPESVKTLLTKYDITVLLIKKIKQGQRNDTIKKGDPLALAFWKAVAGIAEHIALTPDDPIPESEWIVDILRNNKYPS